jgi:hypothetical protein
LNNLALRERWIRQRHALTPLAESMAGVGLGEIDSGTLAQLKALGYF